MTHTNWEHIERGGQHPKTTQQTLVESGANRFPFLCDDRKRDFREWKLATRQQIVRGDYYDGMAIKHQVEALQKWVKTFYVLYTYYILVT